MLLHTFRDILVKKLFGNNLVSRFAYGFAEFRTCAFCSSTILFALTSITLQPAAKLRFVINNYCYATNCLDCAFLLDEICRSDVNTQFESADYYILYLDELYESNQPLFVFRILFE